MCFTQLLPTINLDFTGLTLTNTYFSQRQLVNVGVDCIFAAEIEPSAVTVMKHDLFDIN